MAKAISGHSAPKSGMAVAIAAIPVAPPLTQCEMFKLKFWTVKQHFVGYCDGIVLCSDWLILYL